MTIEVVHTIIDTPLGTTDNYYYLSTHEHGEISELTLNELKSLSDFLSDYVKKQLNSQIDKQAKDEK